MKRLRPQTKSMVDTCCFWTLQSNISYQLFMMGSEWWTAEGALLSPGKVLLACMIVAVLNSSAWKRSSLQRVTENGTGLEATFNLV